MQDTNPAPLLVHVDVDSPAKLIEFYQLQNVAFDTVKLERFYEAAMSRALDFFEKHHIRASFFVVGEELEKSPLIQKIIRKAYDAGHEIENHTWSHPYGLAEMDIKDVEQEISRCNAIIELVTGDKAIGFRSPGCSISSEIINTLESLGMRYDTSGFWSVMNPILKNSHKLIFKKGLKNTGFGTATSLLSHEPYHPHKSDWLKDSDTARSIVELPLPRTSMLGLPFYNNLNLWAPPAFGKSISKRIAKPYLIYLFHIIEFVDLTDEVPAALMVHPNVKAKATSKIAFSSEIVRNLMRRYQFVPTRQYMQRYR